MRILYFSRSYTTHDRRFLKKMVESGNRIYFLRLENDGTVFEARPLPEGVEEVHWPGAVPPVRSPADCLPILPSFTELLKSINPELVQAGPVQSCGFIAALAGCCPLVVVSWGSDILLDADRDELWQWATRFTLSHSGWLFCDCSAVREKVKAMLDYDDSRIVQFPWGIDAASFYPGPDRTRIREREGWGDGFVVLSTRSWEPVYGIDVLIQAFAFARERNNRLRLILMGDGSLRGSLDKLIERTGIGGAVIRPGRISQDEIPDYFRAADTYMSCSYSDGASISLLEAMASGLPAVVTDGPGNCEWVSPRENGWLSPAGDARAFSEALLEAAGSLPSALARMGENNRKIAEQRANWEANSNRIVQTYDLIASMARKAPPCRDHQIS